MSVRAMASVWELDLPDSDKIVLLALADCANDEGHCWPSVASLVRKCSKSERTIQASIKRLVDEGHLTRREVLGKGCNYSVHPNHRKIETPADNAPRSNCPPQGTTPTPAAAADKPSRTINSETKVSSVDRVFDHWNDVAKRCGYRPAKVRDASRRQTIRLRTKTFGIEELLRAFDMAGSASWLLAKAKEGGWKPDLDFMLETETLRRLLEGGYGQDDTLPSAKWTPERMAAYAAKHGDDARPVGSIAAKILGEVRH